MAEQCVFFRVSGQVQGVFYRASTQQRARALGLTGWVRNTEDGNVELLACGTSAQLEILERWLWQGPSAACVTQVSRATQTLQGYSDFVVRR